MKRIRLVFLLLVVALGVSAVEGAPHADATSSRSSLTMGNTVQGPGGELTPFSAGMIGSPASLDDFDAGAPDSGIADSRRVLFQKIRDLSVGTGARDRVAEPNYRTITPTASEVCVTTLWNPQMDVVELGDGTGTIEYWEIFDQKVYYDPRAGYYRSAAYALVMGDELDGSDPDVVSSTEDWDEFGQAFYAPPNLTYLEVNYSRLYTNTNASDEAAYFLWTLDDQGYFDELVTGVAVGESPEGWSDRYAFWDPAVYPEDGPVLDALSGHVLVLTFDAITDRQAPDEWIWVDDVQVLMCYMPEPNQLYLPLALRAYGKPAGPTCVDMEPDSVTARGHTDLGAVCSGSFSATDTQDYYTLAAGGATAVRLNLYNLPTGTEWAAMIYEATGTYKLVCAITTPGSGDKSVNCTLNPAMSYLVKVNAGVAPSPGADQYNMSVTQR